MLTLKSLGLLLILTLAAAKHESKTKANKQQLLHSHAAHLHNKNTATGIADWKRPGKRKHVSGSGSEIQYTNGDSDTEDRCGGCAIPDPLEVKFVFRSTDQIVFPGAFASPPWKFFYALQSDDAPEDGPLGWRGEDGGDVNRPRGVYVMVSHKLGGAQEPVWNWEPRDSRGKFGIDFYQARIDINSAFVLNYLGENPRRLDECAQYTCYPQVCFFPKSLFVTSNYFFSVVLRNDCRDSQHTSILPFYSITLR